MVTPRDRRYHEATRCLTLLVHAIRAVGLIFLIVGRGWAQSSSHTRMGPGAGFRNTAPGVHYVGSKVCAGCHDAIYEQFSRTDMGNAMFLPSRLSDLGWLTKPVDIFNEHHHRHYQVFSRGSKVYESEYELDEKGNEVFRHTEELEYVVGTGVNGATPIVRRGNYLFEAPISYYAATKAWDLSPNYEVRDLGFNLPITADCVGCHSGRIQPVRGREGLYGDPPVLEAAITCENCHGPGELHVLERTEGAPIPTTIDRSIVNPAKLSPWLADNICMNCHEGDIRALQAGKAWTDFRPGTPLNDTVVILKAPIDPRAEQSPLLEHYYSMTLSKCYRGSGGKLGCLSCHDPHLQPSQGNAPEYFRGKCLQCHTENSCTLDLQKRLLEQPADACTNCHMPKRPALTVSHSTLTDHRIVRTEAEPYPESAFKPSLPGTGFIHINAIPGKPDSVPPAALLRAYRQELIRSRLEYKNYYFALLDRLSKSGNEDPFVLSAVAQKAAGDGDLPKAISYARRVIEQGSTSDSDYLLLADLLARSGNLEECINALKKGLSIAPYSNSLYESLAARQLSAGSTVDAIASLKQGLELFPEDSVLRRIQQKASANGLVREGIARFKQGNFQAAMSEFRAAVEANPRDALSHDYIGVILGESGQLNEAVGEFQQAVALDHTFPEPHFHLGLAYEKTGDRDKAIAEYHEALRLNPSLLEAQYSLSAVCAKVGDLDGAIRMLREVIKAVPDFSEAHYNLALNLWNRYKTSMGLRQTSDLDEAAQQMKTASQLAPQQPRIFSALGQILVDRGDLTSAVENLQGAVELEPSDPESHYNFGLALRLKGELDAAGAQFRAAISLNPNHALAHRSLGLVLRESGDFPAAASELRVSVAELPQDAEGHHLLGTVLLKLNDLSGAIEELRRAVILDPSLTDALATLAQALQKAGQKDESQKQVAELRRMNAEKANVGRAMLLVETAEGHMKKGETTAAVGELQEAVTLSPDFTEAHYQLGLALSQSSEGLGKAAEAFTRALQLNPSYALAHLQLGLLLERGDKAQAAAELEKATQLAPGLVEAHRELGRLATNSGDWATAEREFQGVLAWSSGDAATHYALGNALLRQARWEDAISELRAALLMKENLPEAHYDLAIALKASGRLEEAADELRIAQRLNPALPTPR